MKRFGHSEVVFLLLLIDMDDVLLPWSIVLHTTLENLHNINNNEC